MKKFLMAALSAILFLSLAACSAPAAPEASPSENSGGTDARTVEILYGKVKSLVGNSLTLDLAK